MEIDILLENKMILSYLCWKHAMDDLTKATHYKWLKRQSKCRHKEKLPKKYTVYSLDTRLLKVENRLKWLHLVTTCIYAHTHI